MLTTVTVGGAALVAIVVATSACGPTTSIGTPASTPASADATVVTVGVADGGRTVSLVKGQRLHVVLQGDATRRWSPVTMTGTALTWRVDVGATPTIGTTLALFEAVTPGEAELTSTRPLCTPPTPTQASCHAQQSWTMTVVISA
jgi:hypothetical protein